MTCKSTSELREMYGSNWQEFVTINSGPYNNINTCSGFCTPCYTDFYTTNQADFDCPCRCFLMGRYFVEDGLYLDSSLPYYDPGAQPNPGGQYRFWPSIHSGPSGYPQTPLGVFQAYQDGYIPLPGQSFFDEEGNPTLSTPHGPRLYDPNNGINPCPSGMGIAWLNEGNPQESCPPNANACANYVCGSTIVNCDCNITSLDDPGISIWPTGLTPIPDALVPEPMFGGCYAERNGVFSTTYGMMCGVCINGFCDYQSIYGP